MPAEDGLRAEYERLPCLPWLPWRAAGHEQRGRKAHCHERHDARLRDQPARHLRPQELLLPRHGQGLPDQRERQSSLHRRRRDDPDAERPQVHSDGMVIPSTFSLIDIKEPVSI